MPDLLPVSFRNTTLFLVDIDGTPYTPMKPIVEGMGLDWKTQHRKLTENQRFAATMVEMTTVAGDGKQRDMVCFPLRKLPGWMTSIHPNKVRPEIRDNIIAYQNECDDALWDYWSKGHAINPRQTMSYSDSLRLLADEVDRREQAERELAASRPKVLFHDQVVSSETLIDFAETFSLLQRKTGQHFTRKTFLEFLRRHGVACQVNKHANISELRFVPRKNYIDTWFVSEVSPSGEVEWKLRMTAIAAIVNLIEMDRFTAPIPPVQACLANGGAAHCC
ncbi:phage antirepressor N-terminal domain-containing protein [Chromatium okenii]|uniref:phage antirepressor N-terminal domain-containing protein n=1 Tax=Chromatium okenii TaxID=61644 RepID=UPI0026EFB3DA|nr:phage antirepressor N-terminal domain-containing protein [Chromatium okenii]MBV5310809.1 phage antirepressor KilAC domain-containing protein [Chromatium okenii]